MAKTVKRILSLAAGALVLCGFLIVPASAATNEPTYDSYTYWLDYPGVSKREVYSRPMFQPALTITAKTLGAEDLADFTDLCTDSEGYTYLLDGGTSTIFILNKNYELEKKINSIKSPEGDFTFTKARGIFANDSGIYIADTENARVIKSDKNGQLIETYILPDSNLIPKNFQYRPTKVTVDSKRNLYILSDGSYYGAILYDAAGEFKGFFGSNTVGGTILDVLTTLYNRIFLNNVKRSATESRLPFQFTDLYVDNADFVYTATGRTDKIAFQAGQLHCFSPGGTSADSTSSINFADVSVGTISGNTTNQDLLGLALDCDGYIYLLDSAYGRIFVYDREFHLLSAFGGGMGRGEQQGSFVRPAAIETNGNDVLVCDAGKNTLTVFTATDYGVLVKNARALTLSGEYEKSRTLWEEALALDRNSQLAYTGLAKAAFSAEEYKLAMSFARDGYDRETYALAYKVVRRDALAKIFPVIFLAAVLLISGVFVLMSRMKRREKALIQNPRIKTMLMSIPHPFDSFAGVKEKKLGSLPLAAGLIIAFYILTVLESVLSSFLYVDYNPAQFNSMFVLLQTIGIAVLWTISNWAVCTLSGGIGKLREIFTITAYSLIPVMLGQILNIALSHALLPEEAGFLSIITTAATIYTGFMLAVGLMKIHDFGFGKLVGTTALAIVGMLIVLFILFLIIILIQQFGAFLITLVREIIYR